MKRVIKNKKKMKNTMYIVFGTFALALFTITRGNLSYASDGLILDDALDAIAGGNITENLSLENEESENKIEEQNQEHKENKDNEDLEIILDNESDDKGEESQEINEENIEDTDEGDNNEISQNLEDNDLEGNDNKRQETETIEGNDENNTEQEEIKENVNTEQNGQDNKNDIFENKEFKSMDYSLTTFEEDSEDNPYIVYDEENGLITVYSEDFSYGITLQDKNLGAKNIGETGLYYQWGNNNGNLGNSDYYEGQLEYNDAYSKGYNGPIKEFIKVFSLPDIWENNQNYPAIRGGGDDNSTSNPNVIEGYDYSIHKSTNLDGRQGPCPNGYHVPSAGEWSELIKLYGESNQLNIGQENWGWSNNKYYYIENNTNIDKDLYLIKGGRRFGDAELELDNNGYYRSSSIFFMGFIQSWGIKIENNKITPAYYGAHAHGISVRCFKNEYVRYPKTVTFNANGGTFSGGLETEQHTYNYSGSEIIPIYNIQIPDRTATETEGFSGWMFAGWYTKDGRNDDWGEEFDISNPQSTTAYAKWLPFNDLKAKIGDKEIIIMDRNMGAEIVSEGEVGNIYYPYDDNAKIGLLYERGNNYGFSNSVTPSYNNDILANTVGYGPDNYYYSNIFKCSINKDYNDLNLHRWTIDPNDNLWGGGINQPDKDRKGMCPKGYHIPVIKEWSRLTQNFYSRYTTEEGSQYCGTLNRDECFMKKYKIPVGRELSMSSIFSGSNHTWIGSNLLIRDGGYRSSSTYNESGAYVWSYNRGEKKIYDNRSSSRNTGKSIRCFKDTISGVPIILNSNGGQSYGIYYSSRRREDGVALPLPTRNNSTFEGWFENENFSGDAIYKNSIYKNSDETINLYAKRKCDKGTHESDDKQSCIAYKATLYPNGGEGTITIVEKIVPENIFINYGANFIGWNTQLDGNGKRYGTNDDLKEDVILYAQRSDEKPKYTYNTNGGEFDDGDKFKIIKSIAYPVSKTVTNEGHQNEAWRNVVKFTGANSLSIEGTNTPSRTNIIKAYNYDRNNLNEVGEEILFELIPGSPYRSFSFSTEGDTVTIETIGEGLYPFTKYTATVHANGVFNYTIGSINENPSRSGYTFSGWYETGATEPFDFTGTEVTQDRILYAKWNPYTYTITFNINGGTGEVNNIVVKYGEETPLPTITKEGYTFKGWKSEDGTIYNSIIPEGTGVTTEDGVTVTLTAQWGVNPAGSNSSGGGGRKSSSTETKTTEKIIDKQHNSADDKENTRTSEENKATLINENSNQIISVTQEVSEDGTVKAVVETVKIKNTDIVATVRTEVSSTNSASSSSSSATHTKEENDAYSFAKSNGITTTSSIDDAKMNTELTRIQMAKMLSNFAINVLGQEPDVSKGTEKFSDVTSKMDNQYDNAVTKSYQLGIMGQNVKNNKFRPNDKVTRAEFATALSRLLYNTDEGKYKGTGKYYQPHIAKLYNEGIINDTTPNMKEKRGYVMTMLMRTVK